MKIIVNADDFGLNTTRNKAIQYSIDHKICTQTSIIINSPYTDEAIEIAKHCNFMGNVGLHLNLTVGEPLSQDIQKIEKYCNNKRFIEENPRSIQKVFSFFNVRALREEIEEQINKYINCGFSMMHIDFHNDITFNIPVWLALYPLFEKYKIKSIRGVEPYLFGFYRKSILEYLPLKYYFLLFYKYVRLKNTLILGGGRNINQFVSDLAGLNTRMSTGQINEQEVIEIIIHPDYNCGSYIDLTNFDVNGKRYLLEDTVNKLKGFEKTNYTGALKILKSK